jgi:hypothetical protein
MKIETRKYVITFILFVSIFFLTEAPIIMAAPYPAPAIKSAAVYSNCMANGSCFTIIAAYMSGPSPSDISYFRVTGPSGVYYDLAATNSEKNRGLVYFYSVDSVVTDGNYTFEIMDSLGRKATAVKYITYDNTLPQMDGTTMLPADQTYVGTTTPTLSFAPVDGNYYYKVYIMDSGGKAFWYMSEISQATSFTVPAGLLQPETPYNWWIRVFDSNSSPNNSRNSITLSFYTGTKAEPDVSKMVLLSAEGAGYGINWFGLRETHIAPWDLNGDGYVTVTSPDATVYTLNSLDFHFGKPAAYCLSGASPFPMPNGTYTFKVKADNAYPAEEKSDTKTYARNTLPIFSDASIFPQDNTYFNGPTLHFSWDPLLGGPFYYSVRILDYNNKIKWIETTSTPETSVTIPITGNLVRGCTYRWQVVALDNAVTLNNMTVSSPRYFTINDATPTLAPIQMLLLTP